MNPTLTRRSSGILLHPTSLPGPGGTLGPAAAQFIEFLSDCGQSWWQMLPVGPPDDGGSPYNSLSSFAGDPALIDCGILVEDGLLKSAPGAGRRNNALRDACAKMRRDPIPGLSAEFDSFRASQAPWLEDYALFASLRRAHDGKSWLAWDEPIRRRDAAALSRARALLSEEIHFVEFEQWIFSRQWARLKSLAAARGIGLLGDAPIYVSLDSADVWAHQDLFQFGEDGRPSAVAGVPPDYFSEDGQLWGNPLYRWERHAADGFSWWLARLRTIASRFDALRLDHFIGFRNYWEIPATATTAKGGRWVTAPGDDLFEKVRQELPGLMIVAEDLGVLTAPVEALRDKFGFPGMKVAQFAFGNGEADWPHRWPEHCVAYTGTHDNDTSQGWFDGAGGRTPEQWEREKTAFLRCAGLNTTPRPSWEMARIVWQSPARIAMMPMQDVLGIGSEGRTNRPGTTSGNWHWRMEAPAGFSAAGRLGTLTGSCTREAR